MLADSNLPTSTKFTATVAGTSHILPLQTPLYFVCGSGACFWIWAQRQIIVIGGYRATRAQTTFPLDRQMIVVSKSGDMIQRGGTGKLIVNVSLWAVFRRIFVRG